MDITWSAIGKLLFAGLGTYVFFPAALIFRDYVLWKFIHKFILNEKLDRSIREYAVLVNIWNTKFAVKTHFGIKDGVTTSIIDDQDVTLIEWKAYHDDRERVEKSMDENDLYIRRQSNFLTWMLKHYKQDATNPINDWLNKDIERMKVRKVEK